MKSSSSFQGFRATIEIPVAQEDAQTAYFEAGAVIQKTTTFQWDLCVPLSSGADWPVGHSGKVRGAPLKMIYMAPLIYHMAPLVIIKNETQKVPESPAK